MKDNPRVRRRIKILKLEAKKLSEERAACVCTCIYIYIYICIHIYEYIRIPCIKFSITSGQLESDKASAQTDGTFPLFNL